MLMKIVPEFCIRMDRKIGFGDDLNKMKCNLLDTTWAMHFFSFIEVEKTGEKSFKI